MKKIDLSEYIIETEKMPRGFGGFSFVVMSDLHSNAYGIDLHRVNEMINNIKPDAIFICGDMFNRSIKDEPIDVINYLSVLAGHYQIFYALGNHEYSQKLDADGRYGDRFYEIKEYLEEKGVAFLEDETVTLEKDGVQILLTGLEIDSVFYNKKRKTMMGNGLIDMHVGTVDSSKYNILLAHNPEYFEQYENWGANLVLSGHYHGGMIRLPRKGGFVSPRCKLFPKYDAGLFSKDGCNMIVSRGLGCHSIKLRINNNPELVSVKILAKSE